jgi:hypothetical protein
VSSLIRFALTLSTIADIKLKCTIASDLRDQVEVFQSLEYPRFLSVLMPVFLDNLRNGTPVFVSNSLEQVSHTNSSDSH